jgi:hypothetical protein
MSAMAAWVEAGVVQDGVYAVYDRGLRCLMAANPQKRATQAFIPCNQAP